MTEQDYGTIKDNIAWDLPLSPERTTEIGPFQTFSLDPPATEDAMGRLQPLTRATHLAMYLRSFADGGGENGLHSHEDDSVWLVLQGSATFHAPGSELLGTLGEHEGILVPAKTSYRFSCSGDTLLLRIGGA